MLFTLQKDVFVTARPLDPVTDRNAYNIDPQQEIEYDSQVDCVDCSWCGKPSGLLCPVVKAEKLDLWRTTDTV